MAILVLMLTLAATLVRRDNSPSVVAYGVSGIFEQARAYAMANNTYAYVGFFEEDGSVPPAATATPGTGRVVIATAVSKDGTSGYDAASQTWAGGSNLRPLYKLQRFDGVSIADTRLPDNLGGMTRQPIDANGVVITTNNVSLTPFSWPIGTAPGSGQYNFRNVICFDPHGGAKLIDSQYTGSTSIPVLMEIGLRAAHGKTVATNSDIAAVQIEAINGATRIYRP